MKFPLGLYLMKKQKHVYCYFSKAFRVFPDFSNSCDNISTFGFTTPFTERKKKKENRLDIQFKFHFCQISINIGFSLDHPKCILFWWLIFHVISKQKDKTDKSSTKTCHGTRY